MPATNQSVFQIWGLNSSGLGTTISGNGNSGTWSAANPSQETAIDFRWTDDLALFVFVTSITSTPTLKVQIDTYDDLGNLFPNLAATANITAAGAAAPVYIGRHGGGTTSFVVLPAWGRVSWTCSGGTCVGTEISLWAR
jgi:hypothetical protein